MIATASCKRTGSSGRYVPTSSPTTIPCWSAMFIAPVAQWSDGTSGNRVVPFELTAISSKPTEYTATFAISLLFIGSSGRKAPFSASPTIIPSAPRSSAASSYFVPEISGARLSLIVLYRDAAGTSGIGPAAIPLFLELFSSRFASVEPLSVV